MAKDFFDAVYGCIIGAAIGDAMGAPVEGWYANEIKEKYGKLDRLIKYSNVAYSKGEPGTITDDSTLRHYLCYSIIQKGSRVTPDDFAKVWYEKVNINRLAINDKLIYWKVQKGLSPWDIGVGNLPSNGCCMAMSPLGIINAGDPETAYQDGFTVGSLLGEGSHRDAAGVVAAGTAAALIPGATAESIIEKMIEVSAYINKRTIIIGMELAKSSRNIDEFVTKFYEKMLNWQSPDRKWSLEHYFCGSALESLPAVCGILYLCKGDVNQCIIEGANFGRDCDTIATLAGGFAGALQGASAIKKEWIETCEKVNDDFFEELEGDKKANFYSTSQRLVDVFKKQKAIINERNKQIEELLSYKK